MMSHFHRAAGFSTVMAFAILLAACQPETIASGSVTPSDAVGDVFAESGNEDDSSFRTEATLPVEPERDPVARVDLATGSDSEGDEQTASRPPSDDLATDSFTTTRTGLKVKDLVVGRGATPTRGQTVFTHYTGWLYEGHEKGAMFDQSGDRPFSFVLGSGQVIRGWEEAVSTMRPGGKRTIIVPPRLGYGSRGAPGLIPGDATLVFDIELVEVQ